MTEAEVLELALRSFDSAANQFGLILTLVFACLATAYFFGGRLTRFQAAVVGTMNLCIFLANCRTVSRALSRCRSMYSRLAAFAANLAITFRSRSCRSRRPTNGKSSHGRSPLGKSLEIRRMDMNDKVDRIFTAYRR